MIFTYLLMRLLALHPYRIEYRFMHVLLHFDNILVILDIDTHKHGAYCYTNNAPASVYYPIDDVIHMIEQRDMSI